MITVAAIMKTPNILGMAQVLPHLLVRAWEVPNSRHKFNLKETFNKLNRRNNTASSTNRPYPA